MSQPVTVVTATSASTFQQSRTDLVEGKLLPFGKQVSHVWNQFMEPGPRLPHSDWTQGTKTTWALEQIVESTRSSMVEILGPTHQHLATGVAVSLDGAIVAVARTLQDGPKCRLANGDILGAALVTVDDASGLALLSVSMEWLLG